MAAGAPAAGGAAVTRPPRAVATAPARQQALQQQAARQVAAAVVATGAGAQTEPLLLLPQHQSPSLRQRRQRQPWHSSRDAVHGAACTGRMATVAYGAAHAGQLGCCVCTVEASLCAYEVLVVAARLVNLGATWDSGGLAELCLSCLERGAGVT